jgi:hypothetical protein
MTFKKSFLLIVIIAFQSICFGQSREDLWKQDISYLRIELPLKHPNLFFKTEKEKFIFKLDSISELINEKTDIELSIALQEVIAIMGDDHTGINNRKTKLEGVLPLYLYWYTEGIFVLKTFEQYNELLGCKIVSINKTPINQVIKKLSDLTAKTNEAIIKKIIPNVIPYVAYLKYYKITTTDKISITYIDQKGSEKDITIQPTVDKDFWRKMISYNFEKLPLCEINTRKYFWYNYNEDNKILYTQYNRCLGKEVEAKYGSKKKAEKLPSFEKYVKNLITILKTKEVDKFVFDMRYNSGGSSPQGTSLVKQIAQINSINKKGKLFVVTGRRTFSSAVLNSIDFQNYTNAIFIGEPTSGKPNHYGEVKKFLLPNSGLTINYSSKYFTYAKEDTNSFYPEYEIKASFEDLKNGIDPVMEWIINYKN